MLEDVVAVIYGVGRSVGFGFCAGLVRLAGLEPCLVQTMMIVSMLHHPIELHCILIILLHDPILILHRLCSPPNFIINITRLTMFFDGLFNLMQHLSAIKPLYILIDLFIALSELIPDNVPVL